MFTIERTVRVGIPLRTVYNQLTQFEDYPRFMEGVLEVRQVTDSRIEWRAQVEGEERTWRSEIVEQTPDQRIAWCSEEGPRNDAIMVFRPGADNSTVLTLRIDHEPDTQPRSPGEYEAVLSRRVESDLCRFKEFMEQRGYETGGWRGEIHQGRVERGDPS